MLQQGDEFEYQLCDNDTFNIVASLEILGPSTSSCSKINFHCSRLVTMFQRTRRQLSKEVVLEVCPKVEEKIGK